MSVSTSPTAASMWRRNRVAVLVGLLIVATAVFGVMLGGAGGPGRPLDPADASLRGSKALAELLRERGVTVERVTSVEAAAASAGADRLLVLTSEVPLGEEAADRLALTEADRLVVGPQSELSTLAPGVSAEPGELRTRSREPGCDLPAARAAGSAYLGQTAYNAPNEAASCYFAAGRPTLVSYGGDAQRITVVGSGEFMTNLRLDEDGNAALALNLMSGKRAITWLVPAPPDAQGQVAGSGGRTLGELVPPGVPWALLMAFIALVVVALWRARRLGPVVTERLPVVVRAAETVEGRGRLYRARRARDRAAGALRTGTLERLTPRLGLGSGAAGQAVVAAIAVRTGQDAGQVWAALYGPPPVDDAGLVALAGYLRYLEGQVIEH